MMQKKKKKRNKKFKTEVTELRTEGVNAVLQSENAKLRESVTVFGEDLTKTHETLLFAINEIHKDVIDIAKNKVH